MFNRCAAGHYLCGVVPPYTVEEVADMICAHLADGKTLLEICAEDKSLNQSTIRAWAATNYQGFASKYECAREIGLHAMIEEVLQIADDGSKDWIERVEGGKTIRVLDHEHIARCKLQIDARMWCLSKVFPRKTRRPR
jgi:hypothetical protein